jgi:two-component system NtrC family response regulator
VAIDELKVVLRRARYLADLEQENVILQEKLDTDVFEEMLGASAEMQKVYNTISKVAATDVPVLILGESGTGKELTARAIHRQSPRLDNPFIAINCGAIPENLLESELFGHEKGAFTGAHIQRKGKVETADKGTLFLDEIGDLPMYLQVKLLRFLQESLIERVGGRETIPVDTRIISATNVDLKRAKEDGRFRGDLYYRLGVVVIHMPPLRHRQGDLMLLATSFVQEFSRKNRKKISGFSKPALQAIQSHSWPGNVRELKNRLERAVIMAEGKKITPKDLELESPYTQYEGLSLKEARENMEKELVQKAIIRNKGKISKAAEELNISRPALYELIERLGIDRKLIS